MTSKSAFLPRELPYYNPRSAHHRLSLNGNFLTERAGDALQASEREPRTQGSRRSPPPSTERTASPSARTASSDGYPSRTMGSAFEPKQPRILFSGPPPPIAVSKILYRDEEDGAAMWTSRSGWTEGGRSQERENVRSGVRKTLSAAAAVSSSLARSALGSVLFDRGGSPASDPLRGGLGPFEPDVAWRSLQRREKALERDVQHLLDAQSAGLAANLGDGETEGQAENGSRSTTPTGTASTTHWSAPVTRHLRLTTSEYHKQNHYHEDNGIQTAEVIPVRQPRPKPLGLRAARTGLARAMMQMAELKADENAGLVRHVDARKRALAQLQQCAARRDGIAKELAALENKSDGGGDALTRELAELELESAEVDEELADLEARLVGLRNRRRWLAERTEDVQTRREAGLSGYHGALKEVQVRIDGLLRKPPVKPLDVEAIVGSEPDGHEAGGGVDGHGQSPGGVEFLSLRPERRTVAMAQEWWESEVAILERRKAQVATDRTALEEGMKVWKEAVALVTEFETALSKNLRGEDCVDSDPRDKGKSKAPTPEEAMQAQLSKMQPVLDGLARLLQTAQGKGWNLLICAIGAELVAFQQGEAMLRDALRDALRMAGYEPGGDGHDDETTPLARSRIAWAVPPTDGTSAEPSKKNLVDLQHHDDEAALESDHDNDVPADLLFSPRDSREDHAAAAPGDGQDRAMADHDHDSENEVPPEFLAVHCP